MLMERRRGQVRDLLEPLLRPGEEIEVISSAAVNRPTLGRQLGRGLVTGAVGGLAGVESMSAQANHWVALTTERLVLIPENQFGKPTGGIVWDGERADLTATEPERKGLLTRVGIVYEDEVLLNLAFPRPARNDAADIAAGLRGPGR